MFSREDKGDQILDYKQEIETMEEQLQKLQKEVQTWNRGQHIDRNLMQTSSSLSFLFCFVLFLYHTYSITNLTTARLLLTGPNHNSAESPKNIWILNKNIFFRP